MKEKSRIAKIMVALSAIILLAITIIPENSMRVSASEVPMTEPQKIDGYYQIGTEAELFWFVDQINNPKGRYGDCLGMKLTSDIQVTHNWTPIKRLDCCVIDGNGKTISGIQIKQKKISNVLNSENNVGGLVDFAYRSVIKDLNVVAEIQMFHFDQDDFLGGIVGNMSSGMIKNCTFAGTIVDEQVAVYAGVGGICGYAHNSIIENCVNKADISISQRPDEENHCTLGGVVGCMYYCVVSDIENQGTLDITCLCQDVDPESNYMHGTPGTVVGSASRSDLFSVRNTGIMMLHGKEFTNALYGQNYEGFTDIEGGDCTIYDSSYPARMKKAGVLVITGSPEKKVYHEGEVLDTKGLKIECEGQDVTNQVVCREFKSGNYARGVVIEYKDENGKQYRGYVSGIRILRNRGFGSYTYNLKEGEGVYCPNGSVCSNWQFNTYGLYQDEKCTIPIQQTEALKKGVYYRKKIGEETEVLSASESIDKIVVQNKTPIYWESLAEAYDTLWECGMENYEYNGLPHQIDRNLIEKVRSKLPKEVELVLEEPEMIYPGNYELRYNFVVKQQYQDSYVLYEENSTCQVPWSNQSVSSYGDLISMYVAEASSRVLVENVVVYEDDLKPLNVIVTPYDSDMNVTIEYDKWEEYWYDENDNGIKDEDEVSRWYEPIEGVPTEVGEYHVSISVDGSDYVYGGYWEVDYIIRPASEHTERVLDGLVKDPDGTWRLYTEGKWVCHYNDLFNDPKLGWFLVRNGKVDLQYSDMYKSEEYGWWKVLNGKVDFDYSGMYESPKYGSWMIVEGKVKLGDSDEETEQKRNGLVEGSDGTLRLYIDGKLASDYNDLFEDSKLGWYLVENGVVNFEYSDLFNSPQYGWWKVKEGKVDFEFSGEYESPKYGSWIITDGKGVPNESVKKNGLVEDSDGVWRLYVDGKLASDYNDLFEDSKLGWYLVENGVVNFDYSDLFNSPQYGWWKLKEGKVDFEYSDLFYSPQYGWWKVVGGTVDFNYTDLYESSQYGWWKVAGGTVDFNYTDLYESSQYGWWKVAGGTVDFGYTDLYGSSQYGWWKVAGGQVDFGYTDLYGSSQYGWWKVAGGQVDFGYTDLYESPQYGWWKISNGMVDFGFTGNYQSPVYGAWNIQGGQVVGQ